MNLRVLRLDQRMSISNNEHVFTAVFCFTQTEHHLIKLKLYNN